MLNKTFRLSGKQKLIGVKMVAGENVARQNGR